MIKTIYLVRHGKTAGNLRSSYIGGRTDEELCPEGRAELEKQKDFVPAAGYLYVSPMKRCLESACIFYPENMREGRYREVEAFRECDFGLFEGLSYKDMAGDPLYQKWVDQGGMGKFPGGEDSKDFIRRCADAFAECVDEQWGNENAAAMVMHGGSIMSILSVYSADGKAFYEWHIPCGGFYRLLLDEALWKREKMIRSIERLDFHSV